jgi:hypothetical protein
VHYVRSLSEREDGEGLNPYSELAGSHTQAGEDNHAHGDSGASTH